MAAENVSLSRSTRVSGNGVRVSGNKLTRVSGSGARVSGGGVRVSEDKSTRVCGSGVGWGLVWLLLYGQTPKHIRGGWSHYYTDTSKPVDGGVGTLQL
jgi:hypothetical protein